MIKAVFNWSGGKDSALALMKMMQNKEYEIVSLLTTFNSETNCSTMHSIPLSVLEKQADSIGIPLYVVDIAPRTDGAYEEAMEAAVKFFLASGVKHFCFGDIYLHDVKKYREDKLNPFGIEVIEPLWDMSTVDVMAEFIESGLKTIVVTTTASELDKSFIGRIIDDEFVKSLPSGVDICGENGEYHTFCYDGPIFNYPIIHMLSDAYDFYYTINLDNGKSQEFKYWCANIIEP